MGLNREELRKSAREWVKESMRTGKDAEGLARSMQSIVHRISWVRDDQLHQGVETIMGTCTPTLLHAPKVKYFRHPPPPIPHPSHRKSCRKVASKLPVPLPSLHPSKSAATHYAWPHTYLIHSQSSSHHQAVSLPRSFPPP